jgi:G3E family GTPase
MTALRIPITLICGFLGAGKTTLVNRILAGGHGLRIAVLVNDFGSINIDAELITNVNGETIGLANGCVCCTIRDDLVRAVADLVRRDPPPEHIVIETSGVSEPRAAAMGLVMAAGLSGRILLDATVTVVDADALPLLDAGARRLATDQVSAADLVLLNKMDAAPPERAQETRDWLAGVAPGTRVVPCRHCDVPWPVVLGSGAAGGASLRPAPTADAGHDHGGTFSSTHWEHHEPLALEAVYGYLQALPLSVYRAKGFLYLAEVPERRVIVQVAGRRVQIAKGAAWGTEPPRSRLVFIGAAGGVDADALSAALVQCLRRHSPAPPGRLTQAVVEILRRG